MAENAWPLILTPGLSTTRRLVLQYCAKSSQLFWNTIITTKYLLKQMWMTAFSGSNVVVTYVPPRTLARKADGILIPTFKSARWSFSKGAIKVREDDPTVWLFEFTIRKGYIGWWNARQSYESEWVSLLKSPVHSGVKWTTWLSQQRRHDESKWR